MVDFAPALISLHHFAMRIVFFPFKCAEIPFRKGARCLGIGASRARAQLKAMGKLAVLGLVARGQSGRDLERHQVH